MAVNRWAGPSWRRFALFTVAVLLAAGLLAASIIVVASRQLTDQVNKRLQATAAVSAVMAGQHTSDLASLLHSYATRPSLITELETGSASPATSLSAQLVSLGESGDGFSGAFIADLQGNLIDVQPADPALIGMNFAFRDWYKGLLASGGPYVSSAFQTALPGHPLVIAVADYIRGSGGHPLAMIVAIYSLDSLHAFSTNIARAQGVSLLVTDQAGTLLSAGGGHGLVSVIGDLRVQRARAGQTGLLNYAPSRPSGGRGPKELSAYSPVAGSGWTVTASLPDRVAFAGVVTVRDTVLAITALLVLFVLAGAAVMVRVDRRRRQSEMQVQHRDRQLARMVESTDEAFLSTDASGVVIAWNSCAEALFGWPASEALGRRYGDLLVPSVKEGEPRVGATPLDAGTDHGPMDGRIELTLLHRDGHEMQVEVGMWARDDGEGFSGFVHDISERVRATAEMEAGRDQALAASRLKSEFLANMSHEIRTPMNGVVGMSGLLLETDLDHEQRDFAETVSGSAEALLTVIDDILDFSKIEAGKLDIEIVPFDLGKVVEESALLLAARANQNGLELTCQIDPALPPSLRGDPGRLRQVLLNLIGNAVKFTYHGEVAVTTRLVDNKVDDRLMVELSVRDTGIGVTEKTLEHLFEAFTQADTSTTRRYGGTGLGLAISRQLVELMGGTLTATSELGVGSTFSALIPFGKGTDSPPPKRTADLTGLRVLIVDDNDTNRRVLREMMGGWGCRSATAATAEKAMVLMRRAAQHSSPFDVVLLDFNMPDLDGHGLARLIRAEPLLEHVPMVMLTSSGHPDKAEGSELGIAGYLTKPVRAAQLRSILDTVLLPSTEVGPDASSQRSETAKSDRSQASNSQEAVEYDTPEQPRVLLVEDNLVNRKVFELMLGRLGYQVDVATNGIDALTSLDSQRYAAVLMDCQMPVMDGYQATEQLRRNEGSTRHTPVIALTASAMTEDRDRCLEAGMDDYLAKPVKADSLASVVRRWAPSRTPAS